MNAQPTADRNWIAWLGTVLVVLLAAPLTCGRVTYHYNDFSEVRVSFDDGVTLRLNARGAYQDVDSAGEEWTVRGAPYYFHARLDGPRSAIANYRGVEIILHGSDGKGIVMRSTDSFVPQGDDSTARGLVVGTVAIPYEDHRVEGSVRFVNRGNDSTAHFTGNLVRSYKEETRWIFLEIIMGV